MKRRYLTTLLIAAGVLAGCAEPPPPPTVDEYVANKILLDAAMAKCSSDRSRLKYTTECVNAREASARISKSEESERRQVLEAQSERKRAALRRAQMAAAEARRRAEEAARLRAEAEYLAQFGPVDGEPVDGDVVQDESVDNPAVEGGQVEGAFGEVTEDVEDTQGATRGPRPKVKSPAVSSAPSTTDLSAIRKELERRQRQPR